MSKYFTRKHTFSGGIRRTIRDGNRGTYSTVGNRPAGLRRVRTVRGVVSLCGHDTIMYNILLLCVHGRTTNRVFLYARHSSLSRIARLSYLRVGGLSREHFDRDEVCLIRRHVQQQHIVQRTGHAPTPCKTVPYTTYEQSLFVVPQLHLYVCVRACVQIVYTTSADISTGCRL